MKFRMYTLLDSVAEDAGPVFLAVNDGVAIRNVRQMLREAGSPEDYRLFYLGDYSSEDMLIEVCTPQAVNIPALKVGE